MKGESYGEVGMSWWEAELSRVEWVNALTSLAFVIWNVGGRGWGNDTNRKRFRIMRVRDSQAECQHRFCCPNRPKTARLVTMFCGSCRKSLWRNESQGV